MQRNKFQIKRINQKNYHMFDDLIYWRLNGKERSPEERRKSKKKDHKDDLVRLSQPNFFNYAVLLEGRFVAWISFFYMPKIGRWNSGVIYVDELWVAPEHRKKGIGLALMEKTFEYKKKTGAEKIRLYTDNVEAKKLFKKCGFKIRGTAFFMEK